MIADSCAQSAAQKCFKRDGTRRQNVDGLFRAECGLNFVKKMLGCGHFFERFFWWEFTDNAQCKRLQQR